MTSSRVVSMNQWGKDHWSLLAYVESVCVESPRQVEMNGKKISVGNLGHNRMRTNATTHPLLSGTGLAWKTTWGTRLKGFFELEGREDPTVAEAAGLQLTTHDDWDCLDDLGIAGLVDILSLANGWVTITPEGLALAARLREHKANGGVFATFEAP